MSKFLPGRGKLSDSDRRLLMENDGCFFCRKFNAGHKADTCPKRAKFLEEKDAKAKEAKKESISALVVESDSDSEYSLRPKSVPTIKIVSRIAGTVFPSTLVDSGAMINVVSEDTVDKQAMPTQLMAPMWIHEPLNPDGTVVKRKVVGTVEISEQGWESQRPAEFVVAPLKEHDAILGMPFLADENVLIDPAQNQIVLPGCTVEEKGEVNLNNELPQPDKHEPLNTPKVVLPSICPKMKTAYRIIPPKPNHD
jgi:hypothetical protein